ncbi:MAG: type II secretion system protein [Phycisphaerales bacterium]
MKTNVNRKSGFTLIYLLVVIAIIALLVGILLPALARARASARQLTCSTRVRNIVQACVTWANSNKEQYPLPSIIDRNNTTLPPSANPATNPSPAKDNTGNILSVLIWNQALVPEVVVSPSEVNSSIRQDNEYKFQRPTVTGSPNDGTQANWDPQFSGSIGDTNRRVPSAGIGNTSYAHAPALNVRSNARLSRWSNTFGSNEAVWGNRGPQFASPATYSSTTYGTAATNPLANNGSWTLATGATGATSNTLLIHGGRQTWEGNIGYNDGRVNFENRADPTEITYRRASATSSNNATLPDNFFVNELDETNPVGTTFLSGTNNFLQIWSNVLTVSTTETVSATFFPD